MINTGFTLIEITIVLAVIVVVVSFGMVIDSRAFATDTFYTEQSKIISLLEKSRSRAMANVHGRAHGFCYEAPHYIVFYGRTTCLPKESTDDVIPASPHITISFSPPGPVIFSRLSGSLEGGAAHSIHIKNDIARADITINNEGRIDW